MGILTAPSVALNGSIEGRAKDSAARGPLNATPPRGRVSAQRAARGDARPAVRGGRPLLSPHGLSFAGESCRGQGRVRPVARGDRPVQFRRSGIPGHGIESRGGGHTAREPAGHGHEHGGNFRAGPHERRGDQGRGERRELRACEPVAEDGGAGLDAGRDGLGDGGNCRRR